MSCKMTVEKVSVSDSAVDHNDNGVKSGDSHNLVQQDKENHQENVNIENEDYDEVLADDREEGEIVDEFEDIISSDEELTMMKRIEELEATNAELEKIAHISEVYGYDSGSDRYQKPDVIDYGDKVDYDTTDDYHHYTLYIPSTAERLLKKSSILPSATIKSNPTGTVNADRDLKYRHHHHHHHQHHHHRRNQYSNNSYRDQKLYDDYEEERDYISPSPEVLIKRKRKRKHHKTSTRCSKKSKNNEKLRKKKSHHTSPMLFTGSNSDNNDDDDGDENAACILNRDELRMALKRDVATTKTSIKCHPLGNLEIAIDKNENSNGDHGNGDLKVIRTIDLVSETVNSVHRKDDRDNQKLNIVEEISLGDSSGGDDDDDGNDSASLEEQELRLIALKSAIVKNHLARKKRRESDDKRPYSPSDNYAEMYNLCIGGSGGSGRTSKDLSSFPSPALFDTPPLDGLLNNSMDISPITSPELNDGGVDGGDDCVLKPIDMEIVNSDSSNSPSPIFVRQHNIQEHQNYSNFNNCNDWIPIIQMQDNNSMITQNQQHHLICSPKAIKPLPIESNKSYVSLISSLQPLLEQQGQGYSILPHLSPFQQQLNFQPNHITEIDDNEKLLLRRSTSSLSFEARSKDSSRDAENKDEKIKNDNDNELSDEEEFALRALLIAKMNAVKKAQKQQQSSSENKDISLYQNNEELIKNVNNDSSQLVISHNVFEPPVVNNNLNYENQIIYNKNDYEVPEEKIKENLLENSSTSVMNVENLNNFISVKQQQIDKTEFVLKEAVKRLKNKKEGKMLMLKRTFDSDDDIDNDEFKRQNQQKSCDKYLEYSNNSSSPIPNINCHRKQQIYSKNNHEFNDNDIENMINIFENVQFNNIQLLQDNITKYREYKKEQQQQKHIYNFVKLEKENQLNDKEQEITRRNKLIQSKDTKNLQENVERLRSEQQIIHENYEKETNSMENNSKFPLSSSLSKTIDNNKITTEIPLRIFVEENNQSQRKGVKSSLSSDHNQMKQKQFSKSVRNPSNSRLPGNVQRKQNQTSNIVKKSSVSSSKSSQSSTTNKIQQQQKPTATSKVQNPFQKSEQSKQQTSKKPSTAMELKNATTISNTTPSSTTFSKSLSSLSSASLSNLKITRTINDSGKIKKTRTKIINKPTNFNSNTTAKNIQLLKKHKTLKTIINSTKREDMSSITQPLKVITNLNNTKAFTSAAATALKIAEQQQQQQQQTTTTRLITKAEIPKIGKFIIRLGESSSSSSSSSESESEQDNGVLIENYYNKNFHNNNDNASPMSLQMDSPVYSPAPLLLNQEESVEDKSKNVDNELKNVSIGTGKTVVNDVFQAKLDEFLKSARTKVEKIKRNSISSSGDTPTLTTETKIKKNELRTPKEIQWKIIATKTPTAVRHLPQSSQFEYRRLISRMKILEKQKQARNSKINSTRENITSKLDDLSLKTTPTTAILPSSSSFSSIQRTIINDSIEQITPQNSKAKLIKKVLIKNASNLSHKKDSNDENFSTNKENSLVIQLKNEKQTKTQTNCDNRIISTNQPKIIQQKSTVVEKSSKKSNKLGKLSTKKQDEDTAANDQDQEKKHKIELLENYESDLKKNSDDLLENITKTIDLVLNAKNEKLQQLKLLQKYEKLKIEMKSIENNLNSQKKKLLKIYPVISDSHKKITNLRTNYTNLSKITINLGKQIHGENYGLNFEEKSLITNKSAQLSLEIKNLKSLNSSDLEENINLNWIISKKNNLNDKKQNNTGNFKNNSIEKNSFNFNNKIMKKSENTIANNEKLSISNENTIANNEKLSISSSDANNKEENNCVIANKQHVVELSNFNIQKSSDIIDVVKSHKKRENCAGDSSVSEKPKEIISISEECNLPSLTAVFSEISESNSENKEIENEIIPKDLKSCNLMDEIVKENVKTPVNNETTLESKQISANPSADFENDKNKNDVENMEIPVIKVSEKQVVIEVSEKREITEESKKSSFNEFTTYVSPLSHNGSDNSEINDPNGIICPYQLMGLCGDKECKFVHLPNQ